MSKVIKRAIAKQKEEKAYRNFEEDGMYTIDGFGPIALALDHYGSLRLGNTYDMADNDEAGDDTSSVSSFSTTATTDDNPGAGYTVDKYFYQPVGRRIEKLALWITMPLLSPGRIFQFIEEHNYEGILYFIDIPNHYAELKPVYLAGLNSLIHQTQ